MDTIALLLMFTSVTNHFDLPPRLLESICYVESNHQVHALHKDDGGTPSIGVCQVKLATAKWLGFKGDEKKLLIPSNNIYYAGKYLRYQMDRYGTAKQAVIAYNVGNAKGLTNTKYSDKVFKQWKWRKLDERK